MRWPWASRRGTVLGIESIELGVSPSDRPKTTERRPISPTTLKASTQHTGESRGISPEHLWESLTWDQGKEMAQHVQFSVDTGVRVLFCDPNSPSQRGTNENTNGLLRQYFPKRHRHVQAHPTRP